MSYIKLMSIFVFLTYLDLKLISDLKRNRFPFPSCISLLSRLPYEEIARDRILHSQIMEVQAALRCTGGGVA